MGRVSIGKEMTHHADRNGLFSADAVLATLKDFQRRTVEHVYDRMYGPGGVDRFLVADEVGLGKTLVAKGIVAKVVEKLAREGKERVDIVYLCANRDIASQNIDRLNLFGEDRVSEANRLTLLPLHLHKLQSGPNFIAFTPGTALNLKGATGIATERALLYWMVREAWQINGASMKNFFQVGVGPDNWKKALDAIEAQIAGLVGGRIDDGVAARFQEQTGMVEGMRARLSYALDRFQRRRKKPGNVPQEDRAARDRLIGDFRECLARACLSALEPNMIILDEFQRFSSLLDGDIAESGEQVAALGQQFLACKGVKILLLSATPYKSYTLASEGVAEDHHENFLRTAGFLLNDPQHLDDLRRALAEFSQALFEVGSAGAARLAAARHGLEERLRRHIVRTERLGVSADRDGMIEEADLPGCRLKRQDLEAFAALDRVARALKQDDVVEYWKAAPYLLNFMERDGYELKRCLIQQSKLGDSRVFETADLRKVTLLAGIIANFDSLDAQNARLRGLVKESLDRGAWKVLWVPPTLRYYQVQGSPYEEAHASSLTKILVFSNWRFEPRAIAAMLSYEAERRVAELAPEKVRYEGLSTKARRGLLRFSLDEKGEPRELNNLLVLYPSPSLCELIDPLEEAKSASRQGATLDIASMMLVAEGRIAALIGRPAEGASASSERENQSWYTAAICRADLEAHAGDVCGWFARRPGWGALVPVSDEGDGAVEGFKAHVQVFEDLGTAAILGRQPADLHRMIAKVALGSPSILALRSLHRLTVAMGVDGYPAWLLEAAARIGVAFRSLFNQPDATVLTRAVYKTDDTRYWEAVLDHCIAGNLQAVMDEHVHVLREAVGVASEPAAKAVAKIAAEIESGLSMRATVLRVDDIRADPAVRVMEKPIGMRCRSALRFDSDADEEGSTETRADQVRVAFNSPFRPFVLATTSVGQEGLDFHLWCHAVFHWHLPSNPVDFEQREGRVHRYKGHVIRRSIGSTLGLEAIAHTAAGSDPWEGLFAAARAARAPGQTDLVPYWVFNGNGTFKIRRYIPALPLSRERAASTRLRASLGVYRMVYGQPRQEDLLAFLQSSRGVTEKDLELYGLDLSP
jgi:helicase-like protein